MLLGGAAWPVHLLSLLLHLACAMMVYELRFLVPPQLPHHGRAGGAGPHWPGRGPEGSSAPEAGPTTVALVLAAIRLLPRTRCRALASTLGPGAQPPAFWPSLGSLRGFPPLSAPSSSASFVSRGVFQGVGVLSARHASLRLLFATRRPARGRLLATTPRLRFCAGGYFPRAWRALCWVARFRTLELGPPSSSVMRSRCCLATCAPSLALRAKCTTTSRPPARLPTHGS